MHKPTVDPGEIFDTGETIGPGEVTYDRWCAPSTILQKFGRAFDLKFMHELQDADRGINEWPDRSCQLEHRQEYHAFLSYRGGTGRFRLWMTLCAHFNMGAVYVVLCVVFPILVYAIWLKKNLANKIFGYLARCEFWLELRW